MDTDDVVRELILDVLGVIQDAAALLPRDELLRYVAEIHWPDVGRAEDCSRLYRVHLAGVHLMAAQVEVAVAAVSEKEGIGARDVEDPQFDAEVARIDMFRVGVLLLWRVADVEETLLLDDHHRLADGERLEVPIVLRWYPEAVGEAVDELLLLLGVVWTRYVAEHRREEQHLLSCVDLHVDALADGP